MAQVRYSLRFAAEATQEFWFIDQIGTQNFDGDIAIELGVVCPVDLGHAPST
jgi:hypothetical protein